MSKLVVSGPPWIDNLPSTGHLLWIWGPPGNPKKIINFPARSQDLPKSQKASLRSPKGRKMWPKTTSWDTKLLNKPKKWNHLKHIVFTAVMAHAATAFDYNFHPWATKIMDLETVLLSVIPDHRKSRKCAQSWSREAPQIKENIDKNWPLDHQNGVPGTQKVVPRCQK